MWVGGQKHVLAREMLAEMLWKVQEKALARVFRGEGELVCPRCGVVCSGEGSLLLRGSCKRKIHTSSGVVEFALRQVTCPNCRHTWCPFLEALGLAPYQRVLEELERQLISGVVDLSYRKTTRLAAEWLGGSLSPVRLHAAVQRLGEQVQFTEQGPLETLVADGTRVPAGPGERGEDVSIAFQIRERSTHHGRASVCKRVVGSAWAGATGRRAWRRSRSRSSW